MKKFLSIILTVCLIASLCSITALAANTKTGAKNSFVFNSNNLFQKVYFYATDSEGILLNGDFPGTEVYPKGVDCYGAYEFYIEYPENTANVIVCDGRGHQTEVIDANDLATDYLFIDGSKNNQGHFLVQDIRYSNDNSTDMGNVNGDNTVDILDAVAIQKFAVDSATFDKVQKKVADYNFDGNVDILDSIAIQKMLVAE